MNKKGFLTTVLALFVLNMLNTNMGNVVSAAPTSPYIAVVPSSGTTMIGLNHTVSIYTDYAGYDVWGWNVVLAFNTTVLQCIRVQNGDLITTDIDPSARFVSKINNTIGEVSAGAYFYYAIPPPPITTSGPGTLVVITFEAVGYTQASSLTLQDETNLQVYDPSQNPTDPVYRIDAVVHRSQIGHGTCTVTLAGDVDRDLDVDYDDFIVLAGAYGSTSGQPAYKRNADFDQDDDVDYDDFIKLAGNYGKSL